MIILSNSTRSREWTRINQTFSRPERLAHPEDLDLENEPEIIEEETLRPITANDRAFTVMLRNAVFYRVELAAREDYDAFDRLAAKDGWNGDDWADAIDPMFEEYGDDAIGIGPDARSPKLLQVTKSVDGNDRVWKIRQVLDDPNKDHDWAITALVDLDECDAAGEVMLRMVSVAQASDA